MRFEIFPTPLATLARRETFKAVFVRRSHLAAPSRTVEDLWDELWADFERASPGESEEQRLQRIIDWFMSQATR